MQSAFVFIIACILLVAAFPRPIHAQNEGPPEIAPAQSAGSPAPGAFEALPTLNASEILLPQYCSGPNFTVRSPVPTYSGSNYYTIDSDFGVFQAQGNQMLMRRVAEINGIAALQAMSQSDEFVQSAAKAAAKPLGVAADLVENPVGTIKSVPKGIFGFLNRAGQSVKEAAEGRQASPEEGSALENLIGFSKAKRQIAIKLGVDPYTTNQVFQNELNGVARVSFAGQFVVSVGMGAISGGAGTALSAMNLTASLTSAIRDKSPSELRQMNLGKLQGMEIPDADSQAFLNNNAISPTTQTILVDALAQLGNIAGQAAFIRQAATSQDERDALTYQASAQLMAKLSVDAPVTHISNLGGLTVCMTNDGTVVVPIEWDYLAWTPMAERFVTVLMDKKTTPDAAADAAAYTVMITGIASPMAEKALAARNVNLVTKALPGPLQ